mmetsp:Transcript_33072/g.71582  ORF Transcript_33072/g.71582 Transcript_33072/m.71582 type:complete len:204 (+) Transcript_33072:602-1213(+)
MICSILLPAMGPSSPFWLRIRIICLCNMAAATRFRMVPPSLPIHASWERMVLALIVLRTFVHREGKGNCSTVAASRAPQSDTNTIPWATAVEDVQRSPCQKRAMHLAAAVSVASDQQGEEIKMSLKTETVLSLYSTWRGGQQKVPWSNQTVRMTVATEHRTAVAKVASAVELPPAVRAQQSRKLTVQQQDAISPVAVGPISWN